MTGGAGVDDRVDLAVKIFKHMGRSGGADVAEDIGARRGDRNSRLPDDFKRHRMCRHANANQRTTRRDDIGNSSRARQQERQGARPEGLHQSVNHRRKFADQWLEHRILKDWPGNVHDDWVPGWALLGLKDAGDGSSIESIGAKAVYGFSGQGDESARAKDLRRLSDGGSCLVSFHAGWVNRKAQSLHSLIVAGCSRCRYGRLGNTRGRESATPCFLIRPTCVYSLFTMAIETEIKFRVASVDGLALRLRQAGFRQQTPRTFESNVLYDTPDRKMRARTEILRIRSYAGRWTVTHKRLPDIGPGEDAHKHRVETETEVADGEVLEQIFLSLGLVAAFRYEKWRSEWTDDEGHCVIDETPIGDYAELEGLPEWIDRTAVRLGVDRSEYLTLSYGRLFELWRAEHRSDANDLTFAAIEAAVREWLKTNSGCKRNLTEIGT